jgi:hypothetical protein
MQKRLIKTELQDWGLCLFNQPRLYFSYADFLYSVRISDCIRPSR